MKKKTKEELQQELEEYIQIEMFNFNQVALRASDYELEQLALRGKQRIDKKKRSIDRRIRKCGT